jgi:hypothetical protein
MTFVHTKAFTEADSSVATTTLSEDEVSPEQQTTASFDLTKTGGTPFSELFKCCLPRGKDVELSEKSWAPPPVCVIETKEYLGTETVDHQEHDDEQQLTSEPHIFDTVLVCHMVVLGCVLAFQALSVI